MSITSIALPPFSQEKTISVYGGAKFRQGRGPLPWGLHAHPSYRRLQLGLKGTVAGEAHVRLVRGVKRRAARFGFAEFPIPRHRHIPKSLYELQAESRRELSA